MKIVKFFFLYNLFINLLTRLENAECYRTPVIPLAPVYLKFVCE